MSLQTYETPGSGATAVEQPVVPQPDCITLSFLSDEAVHLVYWALCAKRDEIDERLASALYRHEMQNYVSYLDQREIINDLIGEMLLQLNDAHERLTDGADYLERRKHENDGRLRTILENLA